MASVWFLPFCLNPGSLESLPRVSLSCSLSLSLSLPAPHFPHHFLHHRCPQCFMFMMMLPILGSHAEFYLHASPGTQEPQCLTVPGTADSHSRTWTSTALRSPNTTNPLHLVKAVFRIILDSSFPPRITFSPEADCLLLLPAQSSLSSTALSQPSPAAKCGPLSAVSSVALCSSCTSCLTSYTLKCKARSLLLLTEKGVGSVSHQDRIHCSPTTKKQVPASSTVLPPPFAGKVPSFVQLGAIYRSRLSHTQTSATHNSLTSHPS